MMWQARTTPIRAIELATNADGNADTLASIAGVMGELGRRSERLTQSSKRGRTPKRI